MPPRACGARIWYHRSAWARAARLETDYALLPPAYPPAVSARRARVDVDLLDLPAARIPRWSGAAGTRLHFPAAHHDRIRMGTEQRHADGGNQSFVAADRRDNRSGRAGRRRASPIAALSRAAAGIGARWAKFDVLPIGGGQIKWTAPPEGRWEVLPVRHVFRSSPTRCINRTDSTYSKDSHDKDLSRENACSVNRDGCATQKWRSGNAANQSS